METLIIGVVVFCWLIVFLPMAFIPFVGSGRLSDAPVTVVNLSDRRRGPKQAA